MPVKAKSRAARHEETHPSPVSTPLGDGLGFGANSVLGKVRLILEAFEIDDEGLTLSELSRRTGISKASVHRLCQELLGWGMLERSDVEYQLGVRAFELGARVSRLRQLRENIRPWMETLHAATKETIHLAVIDNFEVLYLEKVNSRAQKTRPSRVAGRMPMHCTATGKALLAFSGPAVLDEVIKRGLTRMTNSTIRLPRVLREQVAFVQNAGYSVEREETTLGFASVAVPLFDDSGSVLGALAVTAPAFRAEPQQYAKLLGDVRLRAGLDQELVRS